MPIDYPEYKTPGLGTALSPQARQQRENELAAENERIKAKVAAGGSGNETVNKLYEWCADTYRCNVQARDDSGVTDILLDNYRRRIGEYSASQLREFQEVGLPAVWYNMTRTKIVQWQAWQANVDRVAGDDDFTVEPTPIPDLSDRALAAASADAAEQVLAKIQSGDLTDPEEAERFWTELAEEMADAQTAAIKTEAKDRAKRMKEAIRDQLVECDDAEVQREYKEYCTTMGTGILKGPVSEMVPVRKWEGNTPVVELDARPTSETFNPLDFYPSPNSEEPEDGPCVQDFLLPHSELSVYADSTSPCAQIENIEMLLRDDSADLESGAAEGHKDERRTAEQKATGRERAEGDMLAHELWGRIPGKKLRAAGVDVDEEHDHPFRIIWTSGKIIWIEPNPHPEAKTCYSVGRHKRVPGRFWGEGLPQLIATAQDLANAALRDLCKNMALASGAQYVVDLAQIPEEQVERITEGYNGKIWIAKRRHGITGPPIEVLTIPDNSGPLLNIIAKADGDADDLTVPSYSYGADRGRGAAETATGLEQLLEQASMNLKDSIDSMDKARESMLDQWYVTLMVHDPRENIKGDCKIVVKGTLSLLQAALNRAKITEYIDRLLNPAVFEIWGPEPLDAAMREYTKLSFSDPGNMLPSEEEVKQRITARVDAAQQAEQQAADIARAQAEQEAMVQDRELQIKEREVAVKEMEAQTNSQAQMAELARQEQAMRDEERKEIGKGETKDDGVEV